MRKYLAGLIIFAIGMSIAVTPIAFSLISFSSTNPVEDDETDKPPEQDQEYSDNDGPKKEKPKLKAIIEINPDTLNLKSKGKWITVFIELPSGYDIQDIDVGSILLLGTIPTEEHPTNEGDNDNDGVPDLMVKFNRQLVIEEIIYQGPQEYVELEISGVLNDGKTTFKGSDTIKVNF